MNGLLLIDKPAGWTSHDVVAKLRGILKIKRIGHAGTLDPFATGLLVVGIGTGTKQLTALVGVDKEYEAVIKLGAVSDTFDIDGAITPLASDKTDVSLEDIERAFDGFRGGYEQFAPLHSAKKIGGKKLYDLARSGKATEAMRPSKQVTIQDLSVLAFAWPLLSIHVACGSGTYIRSLADDIGRVLGVGGYCETLRRTRVGPYQISQAVQLEGLTADIAAKHIL